MANRMQIRDYVIKQDKRRRWGELYVVPSHSSFLPFSRNKSR